MVLGVDELVRQSEPRTPLADRILRQTSVVDLESGKLGGVEKVTSVMELKPQYGFQFHASIMLSDDKGDQGPNHRAMESSCHHTETSA